MKSKFFSGFGFLFVFCCFVQNLVAQTDSVEVTFYYKSTGNPSSVFLPGEFNNWGPNNNGTIAPNAPSRMNFDAGTQQWMKTARLRVGGPASGGSIQGAYQYKFNENGSNWLSDPLNPHRNANDNSILYVRNPTIHYLLPNSLAGLVNDPAPSITAYIFPATQEAVDVSSIRLVVNSTTYTNIGTAYNPATKFFSFIPSTPLINGTNIVKLYARSNSGSQSADSTTFTYAPNPPLIVEALPPGVVDGVNYINPSTVTLALLAPRKQFAYVIGDFNDWKADPAYFMKLTPDSSRFWMTLTGLQPNQEYVFQYLVDGKLRIADPYAEKISDPLNDRFIGASTYPNLLSYPTGKTQEIAAVLQTGQAPYVWQISNFQRPAQKDLVIYELLIRDFIARHDYKTLTDTLGYLQRLGVNAIELMPMMEFEGNDSWGYNPSFYFGPDKYYGPKNDLKRFIDACHQRGIAVIGDIVLNHSFGQSPFVRLYSQGPYGPPTLDNPWYNVAATHPFSVGYDFNHESASTKALVDRVNAHWLTEYRLDGFRFDLSKGFTQRQSGADVGLWGAYDASRIAILKRMADKIWEVDSTAYIILEHFAENREEKELAEYRRGMLLWGNMNIAYSQSAMGWLEDSGRNSDLSGGYYKNRGWSKPGLVTYMESHDEEWLMYKNLQFGRNTGNYNIKDLPTALDRIKLAAAFFLTLPGPKMIWQFGELGYDQHLPESGFERTAPKPILWNYYADPDRRNLYKVFAALLKLRNENEVFRNANSQVSMRVGQGQYDRRLNLSHSSMNVTIIGNFAVAPLNVNPNFQNTGKWYDYFFGDSLIVANTQEMISLRPGEFHIYTSKRLPPPEPGIITAVTDKPVTSVSSFVLHQNYPNPFWNEATPSASRAANPETAIRFDLPQPARVTLRIFNLLGEEVITLVNEEMPAGVHFRTWNGQNATGALVGNGIYFLHLEAGGVVRVRKMMVVR